jgi:hypothetical protein
MYLHLMQASVTTKVMAPLKEAFSMPLLCRKEVYAMLLFARCGVLADCRGAF